MNPSASRVWPELLHSSSHWHAPVLLGCAAVIAFGLIAILVSAWTHHRSRPGNATALSAELGWTLIPCLMVLGVVGAVVRAAFAAA